MRLAPRTTSLLLIGLTALAAAAPGMARDVSHRDQHFQNHHPRRDQVLDRTQLQNRRITQQVREGELSHAQARNLRYRDATIAHRQQVLAHKNGGYITKQQQANLNKRLNANSKRIGH